jgi:polysaccharide deacetylase 2 family uncharacterized protein YibQ
MAVLADGDEQQPLIAIIIDDLGNDWQAGEDALKLPGPVTLAFLPHTPHTRDQAVRAHAQGKEIMLHLPMESHSGEPLGPGGLTLHMTEQRFISTLKEDLATVPHVSGLNNHMGSLLTRHPGAMGWLMKGIKEYGGLFFVDSRTTGQTVAENAAREHAVPTARRSVFLDNRLDASAIRKQLRLLVRRAHQYGSAIGICHPHDETMQVLATELVKLDRAGVRLVTVSEVIALQNGDSSTPKTASNSSTEPVTTRLPELWHAPQ